MKLAKNIDENEFFGKTSDNSPRNDFAKAVKDSEVVEIPKA